MPIMMDISNYFKLSCVYNCSLCNFASQNFHLNFFSWKHHKLILPPPSNQLQLELMLLLNNTILIELSSSFVVPMCVSFDPFATPFPQGLHRKSIIHYPNGQWTKGNPLSTPNTSWKKKTLSTHPQEENGSPLHLMMCLFIGCMEILFIKLATTILTWTNSPS
jgi:hypothetical protein